MFTGIRLEEPAEKYHSAEGYISSSPLPEMKKSPAHFKEKYANGVEPTPAMDRGEFIHKVTLEQDIEKYVARPLKEDGSLVRSNSKEYAAFLAENPNKTPIEPDLFNEAMAVLTSACSKQSFIRAFEASDKEASFYAKHEETGLYLKARPDMIAKDRSFILDVKSTADISKFEKQIFNLGYDVRLIHYAETIRALEGASIPEIYFFAIESKSPFGCQMFRLSPEARESAEIQWREYINQVSVCMKEGKWPSYDDTVKDVFRPKYLEVEEVSFEEVG